MKLNPFKVNFIKDLFVFHEKNDFMFLKIYDIKKVSNLNAIMSAANDKMIEFKDFCYCLNIHYDGKEKKPFFSINSKWNGFFYKIGDVEALFHELDSTLQNEVNPVQNPYKDLYFLPFHGVDNFLARIVKNRIYLHDPSSKEILQIIAMFEINLHNVEIFPTFFKLVDDLALKMKIKIDINIIFKNENKQSYMDALFTIVEKKENRFNEILEKLKNTNEFNVILKECRIQKKGVVKLFIKRLMDIQASYATFNAQHFISKYIVDQCDTTNILPSTDTLSIPDNIESKGAGSVDSSKGSDGFHPNSHLVLSLGEFSLATIHAFHAVINREGIDGKFLDSRNSIFDDGTQISAIIQNLSVEGLFSLLKGYVKKRTLKLYFVDPEELSEFSRHLSPSVEMIYETMVLEDLALDGLISGFQDP